MTAERPRLWRWLALYVAVLFALALWRWQVWTYGTDLGIFTQAVADAFGGFHDGPERGTHFRFHWSPLLAVLWPLTALTHSALSLEFAQIVLLGASVIPLYLLARPYVGTPHASAYASVFLFYPPLVAVAFSEFHEMAFFPLAVLGLILAADRARWGWFVFCAVATALVREDACITMAIAGVALATVGLVHRNRGDGEGLLGGHPRAPRMLVVAGLGLTAVNVAALAFYFGAIIPRTGAWQPSHFYTYGFAAGPLALVTALVVHPAYILGFLKFGRLTYALEAFAPLAFLPLFSCWTLLALPGLVMLLLSNDSIAWRMGTHYAALWMPWLMLGALATLVRFERTDGFVRARRWLVAALVICAIVMIGSNPLHPAHYLKAFVPHRGVEAALATVPADATVVTHDEWFSHLPLAHPHLGVFLCPEDEYAIYADDFPNEHFRTGTLEELHYELAHGLATVVRQDGTTKVYHRKLGQRRWLEDCR